jgi:predicted RNase H-like nuclease (RuvC/YqgF family)
MFELSEKQKKDIVGFCKLNNLSFDEFVQKCFNVGYQIEKYGTLGEDKKQVIEVEKIIEKEVIIEKPVEVVIEKEIIVYDDAKIKELTYKIEELTKQLEEQSQNNEPKTDSDKIQKLQNTINVFRTQLRERDNEIEQLKQTILELQDINIPTKITFLKQ